MLYRASENNFSIAEFHKKCDNINNTLVLEKTQFDKVIGGFNAQKWNEVASNYSYDSKTFIFSLSLKQKLTNQTNQKSIYCYTGYGPTFGAGWDMAICDKADSNASSYSGVIITYNINGLYQNNQAAYTAFSGQTSGYQHTIKEWEVYQVL